MTLHHPFVLIAAASLAMTACGSSERPATINAGKVARAIQQSSLAQRGVHASVSCPPNVRQKKGVTFSCTARAGGKTTRFVVTQLDGAGHVHYEAP